MEKEKISCPCKELNYNSLVVQPAARSLYPPAKVQGPTPQQTRINLFLNSNAKE
jgi:hypothetical protein